MVGAVLGTATVRLSGASAQQVPDAPVREKRLLNFDDMPSGTVRVRDSQSAQVLMEAKPGEQSFLRGTVRALARERRKVGLRGDAAFELISRTDGRLTLLDPVTKERVDLESFGPDNAAVFHRLLKAERAPELAASQTPSH
jgi:putative photosynthetic complex assembly protein